MTGCDILVYMPRIARIDIGDEIYHVINRANGRAQIFNTPNDYRLFEELMGEAKALTDMRIFAYEIMPNHWHLILSPRKDGDLGLYASINQFSYKKCSCFNRYCRHRAFVSG